MNKKILVKAYLANNVGNDMFVLQLVRRYPDVDFWILAPKETTRVFQNLSNVKFISPKLLRIDNLFFRFLRCQPIHFLFSKLANAVVHIGGSIFIEPNRWNAKKYRLPKAKRFYLGANFGPYDTEQFLDARGMLK